MTTLSIQKPVNEYSCQEYDRTKSECVAFDGKLFLVYDYYPDPHDGKLLACIPASNEDVAACEIFTTDLIPAIAVPDPSTWSLISVETGPGATPDYFHYVVLDKIQEARP